MKNFLKTVKDKRGSGIFTVMIAITLLTALGSLALYLTYTSLQVASGDRISKEVSYNANTCMEEIKAGIQDIVSDSIIGAYGDVMPIYISLSGNVGLEFETSYFKHVIDWTKNESGDKIFTFQQTQVFDETNPGKVKGIKYTNGSYNTEALSALIEEKRGYECDVSGNVSAASGSAEVICSDEEGIVHEGVILRGVKVTFTGKDNRKSSVVADIRINIPKIGYLLTQYSLKGVPEFTLICSGTLTQDASGNNSTTFKGPAYASAVNLLNDSQMRIDSTFVCKGNFKVNGGNTASYKTENGARLRAVNTSKLWAGNIEIGPYSSAVLAGETYVANDLIFAGKGSYGKLAGSYYGFGTGARIDEDGNIIDYNDPLKSSAIISNQTGIIEDTDEGPKKLYVPEIDLSKLTKLTLAGVSFITNIDSNRRYENRADLLEGASASDAFNPVDPAVAMGESFSGKLNQKLFSAPFGSVSILKPTVYTIEGFTSDSNYEYYLNQDTGSYIKHNKVTRDNTYVKFEGDTEIELPDEDFNPVTHAVELEAGQSKVTIFEKKEFLNEIVGFELRGDRVPSTALVYADYGARLKPIYQWLGDKVLVYFFIEFDATEERGSQENANRFFLDYLNEMVTGGDTSFSRDFKNYLNTTAKNASLIAQTAGVFYSDYDAEKGMLTDPFTMNTAEIDIIRQDALLKQEIFDNYCKTLTNIIVEYDEEKPYTAASNPFDYYVNKSMISTTPGLSANGQQMDFYNREKLTAVIVNGDYTYDGTNEDLCLIVATGDVTVKGNFKGLIFCDGDVYIHERAFFTSSAMSVIAAFSGDSAEGTDIGEFKVKDFFNLDIAYQYENSVSGSGDAWNVAALVTYENWSR